MADQLEVVWPLSQQVVTVVDSTKSLGELGGRRIAFIWDYRFRGDEVWDLIRQEIAARYPDAAFIGHEEFGNIHGDDEETLVSVLGEKLRRLDVDGAVVGIGA